MLEENRIIGKTYSLYGSNNSSDMFYEDLRNFTGSILNEFDGESELLEFIRKSSGRKRMLKKEIKTSHADSLLKHILMEAGNAFSNYLTDIKTHLNNLTLSGKCDSTLTTSREQYLLYMIEIELINRLNKKEFSLSETRYAFLPHCLHDLDKDCLSASGYAKSIMSRQPVFHWMQTGA